MNKRNIENSSGSLPFPVHKVYYNVPTSHPPSIYTYHIEGIEHMSQTHSIYSGKHHCQNVPGPDETVYTI